AEGGRGGGRVQRQVRRDAGRDVQLVGGHYPEVGILELPPPLVADHAHVDRVGGWSRSLDLVGRPYRRRDQDEYDEDRHEGPRQLDGIAAVHLWRLTPIVVGTTPATHAAVGEQAADEQKDDGGDPQHEQRDRADGVGRCARRSEDARDYGRGCAAWHIGSFSLHDARVNPPGATAPADATR